MRTISREEAARFLVGHLGLARPRKERGARGARAMLDALRRMQLDPLDPLAKAGFCSLLGQSDALNAFAQAGFHGRHLLTEFPGQPSHFLIQPGGDPSHFLEKISDYLLAETCRGRRDHLLNLGEHFLLHGPPPCERA